MKQYFGLLAALLACLLCCMCAAAAENTVYLNDGGTGDGTSESAPLGDLNEAIYKIAAGGKVVITDTYTIGEIFEMPQHKGDVSITGGTLIMAGDPANRFYVSGPGKTTFEHLTLRDGAGKGFCIAGRFNEIVMGEGIDSTTAKIYVVGGYQKDFPEDMQISLDSHVTVKSGKYHAVCGSSRGASSVMFEGTSHITVEGGEINMLFGGSINGSGMGGADITVNGGSISQLMLAGDKTRRINGDAVLTVNAGTIGQLMVNNVMGHATVNYLGGNVVTAMKSIENDVQEFVTDGKATLNVDPGLNAVMVALAFDEVNYVGGKTPATSEPAKTAEPAKTTEPAAVSEDTREAAATDEATASESAAEDVTTEPEKTEPEKTEPEKTTEAEKTTDTEKAAGTSAPVTTAASTPASEGGAPVGLIIGIVIAVIVVIAVVVVVIRKKK